MNAPFFCFLEVSMKILIALLVYILCPILYQCDTVTILRGFGDLDPIVMVAIL